MAGGFGTTNFGVGNFGVGGGVSSFTVVRAQAVALNAVRVTFSEQPRAFDPVADDDALKPSNWTLEARDPITATIRLAQFVEQDPDNVLAVIVRFDGNLDSNALYRIIAADTMESNAGVLIDAIQRFADFVALLLPRAFAALTPQGFIDIANPQTRRDAPRSDTPLANYQPTAAGTLALDTGVPNLRKRILRRITTGLGTFQHLPEYGLDPGLKTNLTPGNLRNLQIRGQQQVLQEPDVRKARVTVRQHSNAPNVVTFFVQAETSAGASEEVVVSINLAE